MFDYDYLKIAEEFNDSACKEDGAVVKKMMGEMEKSEETLLGWKASWTELIIAEGEDGREHAEINWTVKTKNAERVLRFKGNGDVTLSKRAKNSKNPSYDAEYNLIEEDKWKIEAEQGKNHYDLSRDGNKYTKKLNETEIIEDMERGSKTLIIVKEHKRYSCKNEPSLRYEGVVDADGNFDRGSITIETHKGNGKVNGTYRLNVNRDEGASCDFISRKGNKVDLTPLLLTTPLNILLPMPKEMEENNIVQGFIEESNAIINPEYNTENTRFEKSTGTIEEIGTEIDEFFGRIQGELPLEGLTNRVKEYTTRESLEK